MSWCGLGRCHRAPTAQRCPPARPHASGRGCRRQPAHRAEWQPRTGSFKRVSTLTAPSAATASSLQSGLYRLLRASSFWEVGTRGAARRRERRGRVLAGRRAGHFRLRRGAHRGPQTQRRPRRVRPPTTPNRQLLGRPPAPRARLFPTATVYNWLASPAAQPAAESAGPYSAVSVSWRHSCGLRTDGTITCGFEARAPRGGSSSLPARGTGE